jgi:hypothetical protein
MGEDGMKTQGEIPGADLPFQPSAGTNSVNCDLGGILASRTVRNRFLWLINHPVWNAFLL